MEEKLLSEKEREKNRLIEMKQRKLSELAQKDKVLSEKESKNEEIRKQLEL